MCLDIYVCVCVCCVCVFFQAEDGIRDLVRSRGLGDVYKRQRQAIGSSQRTPGNAKTHGNAEQCITRLHGVGGRSPVSYTHLTLPTSDLV